MSVSRTGTVWKKSHQSDKRWASPSSSSTQLGQTWFLHLHVLLCEWFIPTWSFGSGPVDRISWRPRHGLYDCNVAATVKVTSAKSVCFCHWKAEGVNLSVWQRQKPFLLNNKILFVTRSLAQGEVMLSNHRESLRKGELMRGTAGRTYFQSRGWLLSWFWQCRCDDNCVNSPSEISEHDLSLFSSLFNKKVCLRGVVSIILWETWNNFSLSVAQTGTFNGRHFVVGRSWSKDDGVMAFSWGDLLE